MIRVILCIQVAIFAVFAVACGGAASSGKMKSDEIHLYEPVTSIDSAIDVLKKHRGAIRVDFFQQPDASISFSGTVYRATQSDDGTAHIIFETTKFNNLTLTVSADALKEWSEAALKLKAGDKCTCKGKIDTGHIDKSGSAMIGLVSCTVKKN